MQGTPQGASVFVGLSGGVDSAVTAALLKEQGYAVTGVFIRGWYPPGLPCTWAQDRRDAMRVAAHLHLPFYTLDASSAYKKAVIDYLLYEYRNGRTPNPDIMCNRDVKFGAFHEFAKRGGTNVIATGHYARLERKERARLVRGIDPGKDQSYFLWAVSKAALHDSLFPLGDLRKVEVRKLAKKFRLPNADKKDSQGICFLGPVSVHDFLLAEMDPTAGKAVDRGGQEVGAHDGAVLYTLGERIALASSPPGPWYVVRKDLATNVLTVSHERAAPETQKAIRLMHTNWLYEEVLNEELEAQYRYHGPRVRGRYEATHAIFVPNDPLPETIAPGQSLVLYKGDECIGGGIVS